MLKNNLRQELIHLADFLNVSPISDKHLDCIVAHSDGNFKRPPYSLPHDLFTQKMNETMDLYVDNVMLLLKNRGENTEN